MSQAVNELDDEDQALAIDVQQSKFLGDVQTVEAAIQLQTTELKQMIDRQSDRLLREVKVARQQREQEVDRRKNDVKRNQLVLQDFQKYSEEVKDKSTTPKGMVGDLLLREGRGLLIRAPTTDIGSLNPGYGPGTTVSLKLLPQV